jgi:hypothetical protein
MTNTIYGKLTVGLIAAWFTFSLVASALHLFHTDPAAPPLPLVLAVLIPIGLFLSSYLSSRSFREFILSLNPRTLTIVHAWRIGGFVFLVLYTYGILPGAFALPAGWGDILIGATALTAATQLANPTHRKSFILWHLLGMADLVLALAMAALARFIGPQDLTNAHGIATTPMTVLPLSLIPTFVVPLLLILHIICIAQAKPWPKETRNGVREHTGSFAA